MMTFITLYPYPRVINSNEPMACSSACQPSQFVLCPPKVRLIHDPSDIIEVTFTGEAWGLTPGPHKENISQRQSYNI